MTGILTRLTAVAATTGLVALSLGFQAPAQAAGPDIQWDYSMPDNFGPMVSGVVGPPGNEQDLTGKFVPQNKMSSDPDYPQAGNALYGAVPADGKYAVTLDACATQVTGDAVYAWTIDGDFTASHECKVTKQLTEGTKQYSLQVTDDTGSTEVTGTFVVKDVLVVIMGDSYASGEGYPPFTKPNIDPKTNQPYTVNSTAMPTPPAYIPDWDEDSCQRTRWSGFVRAAAKLESVDPRSSVTLINVACAGGQVTGNSNIFKTSFGGSEGGLLTPKQTLNAVGNFTDGPNTPFSIPPQIDQINALRKGQAIDVNLLSIGGNDLGFGPIVAQCAELSGYADSCFSTANLGAGSVLVDDTKTLWQGVDGALNELVTKYSSLAACLGTGDCQTTKVGDNKMTPSTPLGISGPNTIQAAYPNLVADSNGDFCNRSVNALGFPNGQDRAQWDKSMLTPIKHSDADWITNVAILGSGQNTPITLWKGNTSSVMARFVPVETQQFVIVTPTAPSFLQILAGNAANHGWTINVQPYLLSSKGGICADDSTRTLYPLLTDKFGPLINMNPTNLPVIGDTLNRGGAMHPNNMGQNNYAQALFPDAKKQAGLPVPDKTQEVVPQPTPTPIYAPTKVKAKTLKSTCGKKHCHVKITFKAPTKGLKPDAYKIKTKVKGGSWRVIRSQLKQTSTVWKKAPWKKKQFKMKVASYAWGPDNKGSSVQYLNWTKAKTFKIKK